MRRLGPLALLIQGHHGGLRTPTELKAWLEMRQADPAVAEAITLAADAIPDLEPGRPSNVPSHIEGNRRSAELFMRLLFSAIVDADFLDTERHFDPDKGRRRAAGVTLSELWRRFEADQLRFHAPHPDDVVAHERRIVYEACLAAAGQKPGVFRLNVPTGGGKTRSAMAFALRHALANGQRRVVVAVPFLTITDQTAGVYRSIFETKGDSMPVVLEHHSQVREAGHDEGAPDLASTWARLSAENWDAPIVVTTTVQLFESLFSNRPSHTRKLHRLAGSVIILDEAQALPSKLLRPILDVLRELTQHYGASVVLSTATQPAFEAIVDFDAVEAVEIVPDVRRMFAALKRVEYDWRTTPPLPWPELASLVGAESQVLVVCNTKRDANRLLDELDDAAALYLSTALCGAHRRDVLAEVRRRLLNGEPCRLIATQVVEAGVDLDFPVVFRAVGPLDGIIQAAGRCNREGHLEAGRVVVFQPAEAAAPSASYKVGIGVTASMLGDGPIDPDDPGTATAYFRSLFHLVDADANRIQPLREAFNYPQVDELFRMIEDDTESVVVAYGSAGQRREVGRLTDRLEAGSPEARGVLRKLQPYLVSVRTQLAARYRDRGLIRQLMPGVGRWLGDYDPVRGLTGDDP
jgi:CRISPR-associated endonuclease/helicase Cas3